MGVARVPSGMSLSLVQWNRIGWRGCCEKAGGSSGLLSLSDELRPAALLELGWAALGQADHMFAAVLSGLGWAWAGLAI